MPKKTRRKSRKSPSSGADAKRAAKKRSAAKRKVAKKPTKKAAKSSKASAERKAKVPRSKAQAIVTPASKMGTLAEGQAAPAFLLPRDGGQSVALASFAGRKVAIFFYPRANTPGCTREAMDFSRLADAFAASQTAVLGVSADSVKAQESFRDKHQLSIPLISDEKHEMLRAYGAWGEKSMYGKRFMGILRTTVLIDKHGKVVRIWRNVRVDGHADEVLATARRL